MSEYAERIGEMLRELDPALEPTNRSWGPGCFLIAALDLGPDPDAIAAALDADPAYIADLGRRATEAGIFADGQVKSEAWMEEGGGVAFWCDVSVLNGDLTKSGDRYAISPQGRAQVERLIRKPDQ